MSLLVRERAPLRLDIDVETPDGHHARWAADERSAENLAGALSFSSTMPGGFEQCSLTLERSPERTYPDLEELSTLTVRGSGGQVAWQGRLEQTPRQSGDQISVAPAAVGWQAALDDDASARMIYLDTLLQSWQPASVQRKINLLAGLADTEDAGSAPDSSTGAPSLVTQIAGPWSREHISEAWYDAQGIPIGALYYAWKIGASIDPSDVNWEWLSALSTDDVLSSWNGTGNLAGAGPGQGVLHATPHTTRRFALAGLAYQVAGGSDGVTYPVYWTFLGVVGNHGLPIRGTLGPTGGVGLYASDVIAHAVGRWAPALTFSTGPNGSIRPSAFPIPQLAFTAPGTAGQIVKACTVFELQDWAVWEGPEFFWAPRGTFSRHWRARVNPAKLAETGPQVDRLYNGAIVSFTDVGGITRTVGPPRSGCNVEDASLLDKDPLNPVNQAGLRRYAPLQMQTANSAAAIKVGSVFLAEQKLLSSSGQAALIGHVEDESGVLWPAGMVRAGDDVAFVDASDPSPRRVIRASYDEPTKTQTVSLDAPPQGLQALLERLQVVIAPLGF